MLTYGIGKDRRENPTFYGAENVVKHLKEGPPRRRVGMIVEGAPARSESRGLVSGPRLMCSASQLARRSSTQRESRKSVRTGWLVDGL